MLSRAIYFVDKAVGAVRAAPGLSLLSASTISAVLLLGGLYAMALLNLDHLALVWGRSAVISVYLQDALKPENWARIEGQLTALEQVERATVVTPEQALSRFAERGPEAAALVKGVDAQILPASVEVHLVPAFSDLAAVAQLADKAKQMQGVASVDYGAEEYESLRALLELLRFGGLLGALVVAVGTAFVVANTIRLTVYARRDEITIERLVGATNGFVRTPFLLEGAMWGAAGGLFAALLLWLSDVLVAPQVSRAVATVVSGLEIRLFDLQLGLSLPAFGAALGVAGSALAVRRFLEAEET